jgi:acetyl esterase/lipase
MRNDSAYNNMDFIPDGPSYPGRWEDAAREYRETEAAVGRARLNLAYGPGYRQRFDLFYPAGRPKGLIFLIHGGYWRAFGRELFSHLARGAAAAGWACALPSYWLCPAVRLRQITAEVAQALTEAATKIAGPLVITGHSAGGHLAARMLCADVALPAALRARIARCVPVSPLADLRPLLETTLSAELLHLDAAEAVAESPMLAPDVQPVDTVIWVGAAERPAFLDQARWLAGAWPQARLRIAPDRHHLDITEGFEVPDSPLMVSLLDGL